MNPTYRLFSWRKIKIGATLPLLMIAFFSNPVTANPADGNILLGPGAPYDFWAVDRALFPGESVRFTVSVADAGFANGKAFVLDGTPRVQSIGPNTLWVQLSGSDFNFEAVNNGDGPLQDTIEVYPTWREQMNTRRGGGGTSRAPDIINGVGSGFVYTDRPIFSWQFNPRMQFADNYSEIAFTLTAAANGAMIDLANYTVASDQGWTILSNPPGNAGDPLTGTVTSGMPGKGVLKVMHQGKEQGRSTQEIAFANLDLAIASFGNGTNLAEDRDPMGGPPAPPHEMDPGSVVIAPSQDSTNPDTRSKLTITGNGGQSDDGTYKLDKQNLTKVKIFDSATGGNEITLPKTWTASELGQGKTFYVGSEPFKENDTAEDGNLILTYERPLADDNAKPKLEDKVRVRLMPVKLEWNAPLAEWKEISGGENEAGRYTSISIKVPAPINTIQKLREIGFKLRMFSMVNKISGTPTNIDLFDEADSLYNTNGGFVIATFKPDTLERIGIIQANERDNINEFATCDTALSTDTLSNWTDSDNFASNILAYGYHERGRARGDGNGGLPGTTPPSNLTEYSKLEARANNQFLKQGGVDFIRFELAKDEATAATSETRQIRNQADWFYYSGHGHHNNAKLATLDEEIGPDDVQWNKDMDVAIIAGCSILDIKDYRAQSFGLMQYAEWLTKGGAWSPGAQWEPTGPKYFLGYCWKAPTDTQGGATIASHFSRLIQSGHSIPDAWMNANDSANGRNACLINLSTSPPTFSYWDETGASPVWKTVSKGESEW